MKKEIKTIKLKAIMKANPKWRWKSLNGQGFYELMQLYRTTSTDQQEVIRWFEMIKNYIRWYKKQ